MTAHDAERWDARYSHHPVPPPKRPEALTTELADRLPQHGRALDLACGAGAQSAWLAGRGFEVFALDVSPAAAQLARAATDGMSVSVQVVDLDDGLPDDLVDFDVIVCQRFRSPALYDTLERRLVVGGVLVMTILSETGARAPGSFHAPPAELETAFSRHGCKILHHAEAEGTESIVVERV